MWCEKVKHQTIGQKIEIKSLVYRMIPLLITFLITTSIVMGTIYSPSNVSADQENTQGQVSLQQQNNNNTNMPNIIFMIGDGMGPEHVRAASLIEYGVENGTIMDELPVKYFYDTRNIHNFTTDSAAGGTALSTGHLTENSRIAMDASGKYPFKTILEYLTEDFGYNAGLVTTTEFMHATPAVFAAHVPDRDSKKTIMHQILRHNLSVVFGGGLDLPYINGVAGAQALAQRYGYSLVTNLNELNNLNSNTEKALGIFRQYNMPYEIDRDPTIDPSIVDMTKKALDLLSQKNNPFFVMIEGGRIDHGSHERNLTRTVIETIMFEHAVRVAKSFAEKEGNTILIVCADHETGGLQILDYSNLSNELPHQGMTREENMTLRLERIQNLSAQFSTNSHTDTKVGFYAYGPGIDQYTVEKNVDVFWALNTALGKFPTFGIQKYLVNSTTNTLTAEFEVFDLDKTVTTIDMAITYENGTNVKTNTQTLTFGDATSTSISFSQLIDSTSNFTVKATLYDNNVSITSLLFTYIFKKSTSSATTPATSTNTSPTSEISYFGFSFEILITLLVTIAIIRYKRNKK